MKHVLFFSIFVLVGNLGFSQNALLSNPISTAITSPVVFDDIEIVTQDGNSVLICSHSAMKTIYAIDINDNSGAEAGANEMVNINNFSQLLDDATGQSNTKLITFEVHPISRRIYALVENSSGDDTYVVEIKDNGADVNVMDLSDISYSKLIWPSGVDYGHEDMAWGGNKLVISAGDWSLRSQVAIIEPPFENDADIDYRLTSMFKTNWGGGYKTRAPLERIEYALINNVERLIGVTVCAPGFSLPFSEIPGAGTLQVKEQFNINFDPPKKVVHQHQNDGHYLFDLHEGWTGNQLVRVGEVFLDGTPITNNEVNANVKYIRDNSGDLVTGLTDSQGKIYTNAFDDIAFWDNCHLLVLENNVLKLFETGQSSSCIPLSTEELDDNNTNFSVFPNPAKSNLVLKLNDVSKASHFVISTMDGRMVLKNVINQLETNIDISKLSKGTYLFEVLEHTNKTTVQKIVIQ